jgi:hypothetical protein
VSAFSTATGPSMTPSPQAASMAAIDSMEAELRKARRSRLAHPAQPLGTAALSAGLGDAASVWV